MTCAIPIETQITCAERELALRSSTYPKWVRDKRMTQEKADAEIQTMAEIVRTLQRIKDLADISEEMKRGLSGING